VRFAGSDQSIVVPHFIPKSVSTTGLNQEDYGPSDPVDLQTFGSTVKIPLGYQVFARSGDKGPNVNIGFFTQHYSKEEWDWLRSTLTTAKVLELMGEDSKALSRVERIEFPKIQCVHFVMFDLLGGGVTDTARPDSLGKVRYKRVSLQKVH
jgi:hypothetical protein